MAKRDLSIIRMQKRVNRIGALVWKEFDFMSKDLVSIGVLFMLPVVIIWIAAAADVATLFEEDPQPIWIIDNDNSELSNSLISVFYNKTESFVVKDSHTSPLEITEENAKLQIPTNNLTAAIIIPSGFEDDIRVNGSTTIVILLDGLDAMASGIVSGQINGVLVQFQFSELENLTLAAELFYFPTLVPGTSDSILESAAPSILGFSLFASINLICTQAIVGDIPLKRILVAPTRKYEVIIGKVIAYTSLAFLQSLSSLFLVEFLFDTPFRGVFLDIFLVIFIIEFSGVCIGIMFSTLSSSRLQAAQLFLFYFILSMLIQLQLRFPFILPFLPIDSGMSALVNVAYRGQSILSNLPELFNLGLVSVLAFGFSLYWFQFRRKDY